MEFAHVERPPALGVPQPTQTSGVTGSSTLETVVPALRFQQSTALGELSHACPLHDLSEQRHHGHRVHLSVLWPQPSAKHGVADPIVMKCSPGGQQGVDSLRPEATGHGEGNLALPSRSVAVILLRFLLPLAPFECARSATSHTTSLPSWAGSQP